MKLIVIYGPPGVGKLTVARSLAKKTGYRIFHNHLTHDLVASLFKRGEEPFARLIRRYRFEMLEAAAKHKVKRVIFTYVYAAKIDDPEIAGYVRRMKKHRATVHFIRLTTTKKELERRILHPSRKRFGKIKHISSLRHFIKQHELTKAIPNSDTLTIDNTDLSPARVATSIKKHWNL